MSDMQQPRRTAIAGVRAASRVCQAVRQRLVSPETIEKKDRSPVTVADFASQAIVCSMLREALGEVLIVGEEDAHELRDPAQAAIRQVVVEQVGAAVGRRVNEAQVLEWIDLGGADASGDCYWTLDPIDGTKGFLRGEQYAVALGLIENGRVVLGALACPNLPVNSAAGAPTGTLLVAERGQGTRMMALDEQSETSGTPVRVSNVVSAAGARFCESVESGHSSHNDAAAVARKLGIATEPVRMDSQAKYAAVARGDASIYLRLPTSADYREKIWDHAAGMLCVEEAGGKVTDVADKPLDFAHGRRFENNQGVIATCGSIHDQVVAAVRDVLGM